MDTHGNVDGSGRIALVDDEENIRDTVGFALRREGYQVDAYADGGAAWEALENPLRRANGEAPQVVILDILMPRMDGLELCRRLRSASERLPILFLTSKDDEFDRVLGLELGADDYLCKPFSMRELLARVKVLFRRLALGSAGSDASRRLVVGNLDLDLDRYQARWCDQALPLTVTEFLILCSLARRPGHVKTRQQLIEDGYPHDTYVSERTIDSHIKRLRKKVAGAAPEFDAIETVYGLGYRYRDAELPEG
ncbi:MAG: response regulator transcription factor [Acidobacteriota bacterium]